MIISSTSYAGGETTVKEEIASIKEWYADNNDDCCVEVTEDEQAFILNFVHFGFSDGDSVSVMSKASMTETEIEEFREELKCFD